MSVLKYGIKIFNCYKQIGYITIKSLSEYVKITNSVKMIFSDEFSQNYEFYKDYDDIVIYKQTKQIFKSNFKVFYASTCSCK